MVLDDKAFLGYYSMLYLNLCNEEPPPPLISLTINRILLEGSSLLLTIFSIFLTSLCLIAQEKCVALATYNHYKL